MTPPLGRDAEPPADGQLPQRPGPATSRPRLAVGGAAVGGIVLGLLSWFVAVPALSGGGSVTGTGFPVPAVSDVAPGAATAPTTAPDAAGAGAKNGAGAPSEAGPAVGDPTGSRRPRDPFAPLVPQTVTPPAADVPAPTPSPAGTPVPVPAPSPSVGAVPVETPSPVPVVASPSLVPAPGGAAGSSGGVTAAG
ncbi:MAG: hypothetical protein M3P48_02005 [Actinomycetota bacterium]|nr:hypothetical protein [Actinomycetota bacterium]